MTDMEVLKELLLNLDSQTIDKLFIDFGYDSELCKRLLEILQDDEFEEKTKHKFTPDFANISKDSNNLRQVMNRFLAKRDKKDPDVYNHKHSGVGKDVYRQIMNKDTKRHKDKTLFYRIALILELDRYELSYLLNVAGHNFTPWASISDSIITYYLSNHIYDMDIIEEVFKEYNAGTLYNHEYEDKMEVKRNGLR